MAFPKCSVCKSETAIFSWQPFGPDESPLHFTTLGAHYRGFPIIKVCNSCHTKIANAVVRPELYGGFEFSYRRTSYVLIGKEIKEKKV